MLPGKLAIVWLSVLLSTPAVGEGQAAVRPPKGESQESTSRGLIIRLREGKELELYQESHALIIGVGEYSNGWPSLPGVKEDVAAVKTLLELHGFEVEVVMNPGHLQLEAAYRNFINRYGMGNPKSRLLFYFAGHGHTAQLSYGADMGYLVPADAPRPDVDRAGFLSHSLSMERFNVFAREIQSSHALFVFDACFAGSVFSPYRSVPESISYKTASPVRQFITSGEADEEVPDRSIFRRQFEAALRGAADLNGDGYITGVELGEYLQDTVIEYTGNAQHPQYGKIQDPNLDKGDYVIALAALPPPPPEVTLEQRFKYLEIDENRRRWDTWLAEMEDGFEKALALDGGEGSATFKADAWNAFLETYGDEDPYSDRDNDIRDRASSRMKHWHGVESAQQKLMRPSQVAAGPAVTQGEKGNEVPPSETADVSADEGEVAGDSSSLGQETAQRLASAGADVTQMGQAARHEKGQETPQSPFEVSPLAGQNEGTTAVVARHRVGMDVALRLGGSIAWPSLERGPAVAGPLAMITVSKRLGERLGLTVLAKADYDLGGPTPDFAMGFGLLGTLQTRLRNNWNAALGLGYGWAEGPAVTFVDCYVASSDDVGFEDNRVVALNYLFCGDPEPDFYAPYAVTAEMRTHGPIAQMGVSYETVIGGRTWTGTLSMQAQYGAFGSFKEWGTSELTGYNPRPTSFAYIGTETYRPLRIEMSLGGGIAF